MRRGLVSCCLTNSRFFDTFIHRCYWRRVLPLAIVLAVIPNLLCALADGYWGSLSLRCLAGLGVSMMTVLMYATMFSLMHRGHRGQI